jgi:hypothetical protein
MTSRLWLALFSPLVVSASILNPLAVDESKFRVTTFASNQPFVTSVLQAKDKSILALVSPGYNGSQVVRFTDNNADGLADAAPVVLYSNNVNGPATHLRQAGDLLFMGEFGASRISALRPGATPADPLTQIGSLDFQFVGGHAHPTMGFAVRPTPGTPGSVDLIFNVGSQFNDQNSTAPVVISGFGLAPTNLQGDSLYMITINEAGPAPVASNLRTVATGIRNVYGMAFHPTTGDLYFADNAIDESNPTQTSEPVQADELNRIAAADIGVVAPFFGYPNCYPAYRTGVLIETVPGTSCSGVTQSLLNYQPVNNQRSEGPTEIAFAPSAFPSEYAGGIFTGFSGGQGPGGVNNQNALVFSNASFSQLLHFVESATPGVGSVLGVHSTQDSLFLANFGGGQIYQITAIDGVPEPGSLILSLLGLSLLGLTHARRSSGSGRL